MPKKEIEQLKHIIYASRPLGFDEDTVNQILKISRKNNPSIGVTGLLICGEELYLQILEGPMDAVDKIFNKIKIDNRHDNVKILKESSIDFRLFASWAMRSHELNIVRRDTDNFILDLIERLSPSEAFNLFNDLSKEFDQLDYTHK